MYKSDVPKIVDYIEKKGPNGTLTAGIFVLCTVQTPLSRVKPLVEDVLSVGMSSSALWGWKRDGYHHLRLFQTEIHTMLLDRSTSREDCLYRLLACCGLGLPKAAFLMQLHGWNTSCIDVHNAKMFGVAVPKVTPVMKPQTKERKVLDYLTSCDKVGDTEFFWDEWCSYVAGNRMNKSLPTAETVSSYHKECICG